MLKMLFRIGLGWLLLGVVAKAESTVASAYHDEVESWRAERTSHLTDADGWLSLIGLHFLERGENRIGSAADNQIVLAAGPAHLGKVTLLTNGEMKIQVNPGLDVKVDGREVLSADLDEGRRGRPTLVTCETMSFYVINRGERRALRVKDSATARRTGFVGIDYYPIDPSWRIEAKWVPFAKEREVPIENILGQVSPATVLGEAVFERDGHTMKLLPLQSGPGEPLFFIIADETSGKETYSAARFVYADPPMDGVVVLDFNKAINPPCAFTPFATCPLPPAENRMPIAVTAGEKDYRGAHDRFAE